MFFFQAEDGIRDLVRSRGLGDVYKRQVQGSILELAFSYGENEGLNLHNKVTVLEVLGLETVSYTHLTLPTSDLV